MKYENVSYRCWTELRQWVIECEDCGKQASKMSVMAPSGLPEGWTSIDGEATCKECYWGSSALEVANNEREE